MTRLRGSAIVLAAALLAVPAPVAAAGTQVAADPAAAPAAAPALADGFMETTVWSGLTQPTAIRFAADGRAFVIEKSGQIKVFSSLADTTPTTSTVLMSNTFDYWDHGLLGLALDPSLTGGTGNGDYLYVGYTYDHILGDSTPAPRWYDKCPSPPGPTTDGCVSSSHVSRLPINGTTIGAETVLVENFCQQGPSHGMGSLAFGPDGSLYVTHGEGGLFFPEYGNGGGTTNPVVTPKNPCGDPPGGVGGAMTSPTAEGGWLRAQDMRTTGDPAGLDGAVIRINPMTGDGVAGSPFAGSGDANARRIIAYGLRNPFRAAFRPGTKELWIGDVGWETWEELNLVADATDNVAENFGWPCFEGAGHNTGYQALNLSICTNLYAQAGAVTAPRFTYNHNALVTPTETCPTSGGSSIDGMAFYPESGGSFPASFEGGLFFGDYSRNCIWFMPAGLDGKPDPAAVVPFEQGAAHPVDMTIGPDGDLFYVDFDGGTIRRISPAPANRLPTAVIRATPAYGATPLTVAFDGTGSSDPEGTPLAYAWDLDGDGAYDDATGATTQWTYQSVGNVTAALRVTDGGGAIGTATQVIGAGNTPPRPVISLPDAGLTWHVGETIQLAGSAMDDEDGALDGASLTWNVRVRHCPSACHSHPPFWTSDGLGGTFAAPDHSYPSTLLITLIARDSAGATATVTRELSPEAVQLTVGSSPPGIPLTFNGTTNTAAFTQTVIVGSMNTITAPTTATLGTTQYVFKGWSDGRAWTHDVVAPAVATTYTATYKPIRQIAATVDARVESAHPYTNYGASTILRVKRNVTRSYIKFVVTGLSARPTIAKLRLWVTNGSSNGGFVYKVSSSWSESTITWHNRPLVSGSSLSWLGAVSAGTWVEFNVTSAITGNGTFSFAILNNSDDYVDYASTETTKDPLLVLTP